jgi:hypothetical protein
LASAGKQPPRVTGSFKDRSSHARRSRIDVTGNISPFGVFNAGIGTWVYLPIVPDGFIPSLNDTFGLEFGAYGQYFSDDLSWIGVDYEESWWAFTPLGGVRWDFHLTPGISVFAKGKLGYQIGFGRKVTVNGEEESYEGTLDGISHFAVDAGVGAYFHFGQRVALRLEAGNYTIVSVGVSFAL